MQKFKPSELIPHPQNDFFFDPMEGQKWQEFLESVRTSGVIEPPVVTSEGVIVSGHQRVRACIELGIEEIYCEVRKYDDPDRVLKDLIETNIRQRGTIAGSELKMGRIIKELERIYGVQNGNNQHGRVPQVAEAKSQSEIAKELGMSVDKMSRFKKLADLPDEYQEMLETGRIRPNTAVTLISKLTDEEQQTLLKSLPATEKITHAVAQQYIDQIRGLEKEKEELNREKQELQKETVEAVRVARGASKASEDSAEYIANAEKAKKKEGEARDYYEKWQEEKKKSKGLSDEEVKKKIEEATEALKRQYQRQADDLTERINNLEDREPEVVERIPDDYEDLKAENERLRKAASRKVSKEPQIRVVDPDRTKEELAQVYFTDAQNSSGPFLAEMEGLVLSKDLCDYLPDRERNALAENFRLIISRAEEILGHLWKTNKEEIA